MPNSAFRLMAWIMSLMDMFSPSGVRGRLRKIPLKTGMTVVDYACGPGRYTIPIAQLVGAEGRVYAVDIQPLAIETVKKKAAKKGLTNIETVLVDSYHSGIADSVADIVLLIDMIHGIGDRAALFHEVHRLLKPDGYLFVDAEHTSASEVRSQLENSSLFALVNSMGRDMLFKRR